MYNRFLPAILPLPFDAGRAAKAPCFEASYCRHNPCSRWDTHVFTMDFGPLNISPGSPPAPTVTFPSVHPAKRGDRRPILLPFSVNRLRFVNPGVETNRLTVIFTA